MTSYLLAPWPDPLLPAVRSIAAQVTMEPRHLLLRFALAGEVVALRLPGPAAQPRPQDDLWRHTCFEIFVGDSASSRYAEFNFSPSGCWAGYAFAQPRVRAASGLATAVHGIRCQHDGRTLELEARLDFAALDWPITPATPIGLSAVLETRDRHLTYWALGHPGAGPDFHDRRGWIARAAAREANE